MATCTLKVADRVVLLSKGGPPEAEYALFDSGDITLSADGPGLVREVSYRTTAQDAIGRLESAGVNLALAHEAASAIGPSVAMAYARGPHVRRLVSLLGPGELFDGGVYDAELRRYDGRWIDLPALALDVEISRAATLMQALSLVALLTEVEAQTWVTLTTQEYSAERRPGERSYRRVALEHAVNLPQAFRSLAARGKQAPTPDREGPTRDAIVKAFEERALGCTEQEAKDRILAIVAAMRPRQRPNRGPLSVPDLWLIEEQLSNGNTSGVFEELDAIERSTGRNPATSYLRARVSLMTGREPARLIAERAGALAMSMTSFAECTLLAAEAWNAAGDVRRAVPFARDLVSNPTADEDIRARALQIVEAAERSGRVGSVPPAPEAVALKEKLSNRPRPPTVAPPPPPPPDESETEASSGAKPRSLSDELTIDLDVPVRYPSGSHRAVQPAKGPASRRPERIEPPAMPRRDSSEGLAPPSFSRSSGRMRAAAPTEATPRSSPSIQAPAERRVTPVALARDPSIPPSPALPRSVPRSVPAPPQIRTANWAVSDLMRGASQPPFRQDSPGAHAYIPKAAKVPVGLEAEAVEMLAMPPGLSGSAAPLDTLPSSVIDARVQFTLLSRELAREYREDLGITLHVDLASIEAMQAQLLERYPDRTIQTFEQAVDVRKHGALLSEILARTFDAFWVDIAPSDLGYWAMVAPPDTRIWPFGRILRLIAMQHKERDLVAYYLELKERAKSSVG